MKISVQIVVKCTTLTLINKDLALKEQNISESIDLLIAVKLQISFCFFLNLHVLDQNDRGFFGGFIKTFTRNN